MKSNLIQPDNTEQLKTAKTVLRALKVRCEPQTEILPAHVTKGIEKSLGQYEAGQTISLPAFKEQHFSKK